MGGARPHAVVRALAEEAYSLVVADLSRPAWSAAALSGIGGATGGDDLPARMRTLEAILGRPGSLLWDRPPRPEAGKPLNAAQQDLQWAIGAATPMFCSRFASDPIAVQALAATVMAWGAAMPHPLKDACRRAAMDDPGARAGNGARRRHMAELATLVDDYEQGRIRVVSGDGF